MSASPHRRYLIVGATALALLLAAVAAINVGVGCLIIDALTHKPEASKAT